MISVIVPIYNVENYLRPCVDSILNSTYRDIELILVDDGSTDASPSICDQYAGIDSRVRVIHKVNQGVSEARNTGLDAAEGDFIMFVDGDDVIHPNMIQVLYQAINDGDYDFSMVKGKPVLDSEYEDYLTDPHAGMTSARTVLNQDDMVKGLFGPSGKDFQYIVVWNKLFKRDLVRDVRFIKTGSEDAEWTNRVCMKMKNAVLVEDELYYWLQHKSSMTHKGMNPTIVDRINSYFICFKSIPDKNHRLKAYCLEKLYKVILHTRYNAEGSEFVDKVNILASTAFRNTIKDYLHSGIHWKTKYGLLCFYFFPSLHRVFMKKKESPRVSNPFRV